MKPLLGMFYGEAGSKRWKAAVDSVLKSNPPSLSSLLEATLHHIPDAVLDSPPRAKNELPRVSLVELATDQDRAGGGKTMAQLKRELAITMGKLTSKKK